ncbi:hypothetical protein E4T56_gene4038, partial [Termitomyces sp. T112]
NLKRKRAAGVGSRKSRKVEDELDGSKVEDELDGSHADIHHSDEDDALSVESERDDESVDSEQEEGGGEWIGLADEGDNAAARHEP